MKKLLFVSAACAALLFSATTPAYAAGCLKGAVVGGLAGHALGHHAVLGAMAGCAVGRHMAKEKKQDPRHARTL
ncbi:hypothetical protein [Burkholderia sp. Ac-20365]|uniref:hypothetical protein n=1 Tax=Burkholderia sp. Ac-20365 TaxID=2703897 RepID=UPI00197CABE2|nr:hypothetical protein [Burkholderia sp. Ac-20365]MBN3761339.1 hypothetical protein [Burkholderia sp. Ac-20365]